MFFPSCPQFHLPKLSWWTVVCPNQTPRVVQVEALPLLMYKFRTVGCQLEGSEFWGDGGGRGSVTGPFAQFKLGWESVPGWNMRICIKKERVRYLLRKIKANVVHHLAAGFEIDPGPEM